MNPTELLHAREELSRGAIAAVVAYFKANGVALGHACLAFDVPLAGEQQTVVRMFGAPRYPAREHIGCHHANLAEAMGIIDGKLNEGLIQIHFDADGDATHVVRVTKSELESYYQALGLVDADETEEEIGMRPYPEGTMRWLGRLRDIRRDTR